MALLKFAFNSIWLIATGIFLAPALAAGAQGGECAGLIPKATQFAGHYSGFAMFHAAPETVNASALDPPSIELLQKVSGYRIQDIFDASPALHAHTKLWNAKCNLFRSTNRFWEAYVARFELTDDAGRAVQFTARGIRPSNSRMAFVRGVSPALEQLSGSSQSMFRSVMHFLLGGDPAANDDSSSSDYNSPSSEDYSSLPFNSLDDHASAGDTARCQISGSLERNDFLLEDENGKEAAFSTDKLLERAPLETNSEYFTRPPDLIARLMFSTACSTTGHVLSLAFRKFDLGYFRSQQTRVGVLISLFMQIYLFAHEYKKIESQRAILKSSWLTLFMCIVFDAFEAQFFFGRQSLGNDVNLPSPLALVGVLKCMLIIAVQLRWIIMLWRERSIQRRHQAGDNSANAWIKDMNQFIRWFAGALVIILFTVTRFFETIPELIILVASLFFVPQIIQNLWNGTRHPLSIQFVVGILICRAILPWLLWSAAANELVIGQSITQNAHGQGQWPSWFAGDSAPPIPKVFMDSTFGTIPRRPDTFMLALVGALTAWQGAHLLLQNMWSPRVGVPGWFCARYLPVVFDYELDVSKVAASKQAVDPELTGVDCVICMTLVKFADSDCLVSPCEHFFHKACLSTWMEVKLECPTCRRAIPSL